MIWERRAMKVTFTSGHDDDWRSDELEMLVDLGEPQQEMTGDNAHTQNNTDIWLAEWLACLDILYLS